MVDIRSFNRAAWDRQVLQGNPWTIPVTSDVIDDARNGRWKVVLTPTVPVPATWFPPMTDARILCLASAGGQQGPIFAAAGADVTVFDNSPRQLAQDRFVAERDNLRLRTVVGDMRDLSCFADEAFDLVFHPVSNTFVPEVKPVWLEAFRVLRHGGCLLSGFDNPALHIFDYKAYERGQLVVANRLPWSEADSLSDHEIQEREHEGSPLEFGHTLEAQIGGQIDAGFVITGFYEDTFGDDRNDPLEYYMSTFIATRALKMKKS